MARGQDGRQGHLRARQAGQPGGQVSATRIVDVLKTRGNPIGSSLVLCCMPCLVIASQRFLWDVYQVPKVNVARCLFEHPNVKVDVVEVVVHIKVRIVEGAHKGEHGARFLSCGDRLAHAYVADLTVDVGIGVHIAKHHVDTGVVGHRKDERGVAVAVGVLTNAGDVDVFVRL